MYLGCRRRLSFLGILLLCFNRSNIYALLIIRNDHHKYHIPRATSFLEVALIRPMDELRLLLHLVSWKSLSS